MKDKFGKREYVLCVRFSDAERLELEARAEKYANGNLGTWARFAALNHISRQIVERDRLTPHIAPTTEVETAEQKPDPVIEDTSEELVQTEPVVETTDTEEYEYVTVD